MIFKILNDHFSYLREELGKDRSDLSPRLNSIKHENGFVLLDADEDTADEIRDWAGERLQMVGFDKSYGLTKVGIILEDLIDIFYL